MVLMIEVIKGTSLQWTLKAQTLLKGVRDKLTRAPLLALTYFEKFFQVECDTSGIAIGGILVPEGKPLAFLSEKLWNSR